MSGADDDVDAHHLLRSLFPEVVEAASLVDGVHVDELDPLVAHLVAVGEHAEAQRTTRLADATRARVRLLERGVAHDLDAALTLP